ncbi:hypothetical protein C8Q74DRAFT_1364855 [Fomes fomentarius]|nr:hypothetical protein C8Q74DRAFT_1364855 [Fomes fomentarius]
MSTTGVLTTTVIVLELCNILLFTLLLVTPAPKHSMVKALIISCLIRSVLDIIPPIVHKIVPLRMGDELHQHPGMINFCVAQSILLRYLTVAKAAFAVSFTLPCLSLALLQAKPKRSADDYPRLTRRSVLILCAAPFVWALPVLITALPPIIQGQIETVYYDINSCYFSATAFTIVSMVFTLIPLAIAVIITSIMGVVIWRYSDTILEQTGWLFVKTKRFGRFAGLVFVTMISAALYTGVISLWFRAHGQSKNHDPVAWRNANPVTVRFSHASVLWEAMTPLLFFFIFAAQDEIYETWQGWFSHVLPIPRKKHDGCIAPGFHLSQHVTQGTAVDCTCPAQSTIVCDVDQMGPVFPEKIMMNPLSSAFTHHSDWRRGNGLPPPPPHRSSKVAVTSGDSPRTTSRFRMPFQGPSLTTFGSQFSTESRYNAAFPGDLPSAIDHGFTENQSENDTRDGMRSGTPGSLRTFGRSPPANS